MELKAPPLRGKPRAWMVASAAGALAASVVVTSGPVAPAALNPLPANVRAVPYLPQGQVLEHADALVSHGGAGSTLGGLVHGVPHLVLPQGAPSQQRCAEQITRLGAGLVVSPAEQSLGNVQSALQELLATDTYRATARRVAADLERLPDVGAVADELLRRYR